MNSFRLFVLLAWESRLGSYIAPVGVLGIGEGGAPQSISWVPFQYEPSRGWRRRLARAITPELFDEWLVSGQLAEVEPPPGQVAMAAAVEGLLDQLLIEVVPSLQAGGG